jgi:chromosome segregation and condensation protein ScpB
VVKQRPATDLQLEVLSMLAFRSTFREIAKVMGGRSTNAVNDHVRALVRKGLLRATGIKGSSFRYVPTPEGLEALCLKTCDHCDGSGLLETSP